MESCTVTLVAGHKDWLLARTAVDETGQFKIYAVLNPGERIRIKHKQPRMLKQANSIETCISYNRFEWNYEVYLCSFIKPTWILLRPLAIVF